ncbi:protein of unknown function UPF0180 [Alkaliphilus metalliredigens QYMF]|uniref:YkuS family protein n=1 Tax=Alkaliphilus metalliredigens (strain QYMF) TaxID=293826 RepID=A6TSX1_ALKMQ|nr:YkuS family protein [Alkaliphilus metalliredigens]ABR49289.1 protein of unknown function UPF0180 [Alkaliphilus metalliredigens QYMF]
MKRKVAIENSLGDVKTYLQEQGFQVEELRENANLDSYDAVIVTGQDSNMLGMENAVTKAPVITARGQSAEQIYDRIKRSFE